MVLAIDPGQQGAFVWLEGDFFEWAVMPLKADGSKDVDFEKVRALMNRRSARVFLERAHAGAMGTTGAFNYGRAFAALEIAILLSNFPVTYVEPAKWAKVMHDGISKDLKPKAKSTIAVERLFKKFHDQIPKNKNGKMHEGVMDALLLAGYGERISGLEQKSLSRDDF